MGRAHEVRKVAMAKTAAKKAKLYSRYGKEIYLAAKAGGPEPDGNLALRRLIEKAKKEQVPADVIKRAIDKVKSGVTDRDNHCRFALFCISKGENGMKKKYLKGMLMVELL